MVGQPRPDIKTNCLTKDEIIKNVGEKGIILNSDGTVSVFTLDPKFGLYPVQLTLECCKVLDPKYYFDINTQSCRWAQPHNACGFSEPINLVVNPKGDDGTLFFVDDFEKEKCDLKISFDYLLKIKCEDLLNLTNPTVVTNIQTQEITDQTIKIEQLIAEVNVNIETLSNEIVVLNQNWVNTPYSLDCDMPCTRPTNLVKPQLFSKYNGVLITSYATACNAINASTNGTVSSSQGHEISALVVGGYDYAINQTNDCSISNGNYWYIVKINSIPKIINIQSGIIVYLGDCSTPPSNAARLSAFNNSGFNTTPADTATNLKTVLPTTHINKCLTPYGLTIWETILGPTNYNQFILGNHDSYTCAQVAQLIAAGTSLCQFGNADCVLYDCTIPFGTKSQIKVQIDTAMAQLTQYNNTLTEYENVLIKLQNDSQTIISESKGCQTPIEALESLDVEMHLDIVNADNTLTSVFTYPIFPAINATSNLYNYLTNNTPSGFYICGDPSKDNVGLSNCTTLSLDENLSPNVDSCNSIVDDLVSALIRESGNETNNIAYNAFASPWKTYTHMISNVSDPNIIAAITNKKIKISFRVKFSCVDFCLLLDNLVLDKSCKSVDRHDITISQNPGFDLKRVIDNKKSWIDTTTPTNREFLIAKNNGNNPIRQTDYNVNDERLVINSKEIDLDISVASAIETDVWCYLNDNPCVLTAACTSTIASTTTNPVTPGQTIVFSGTPITISDCTSYNGKLANRTADFIQTTPCGTITYFRLKEGFPLVYVYYWLVQQPNGDIGYYYQNSTSIVNISNIYQNGKDCCEYLNKDLKTYNKAVSYDDKIEVYWDEDCQRCKVEKARCGDINLDLHSLLTQPISAVTTIEQFENLMTTEFIDVKNRQTISSYPTLRAVYDRYLNSSKYCNTVSSAFDYQNMDKFAGLIGSYWVDLIEQVVPSTTIWGSVKIYTNTIFDEQKFKYKPYSILLDKNPFQGQHVLSPINGVDGICEGVNVISSDLSFSKNKTLSASNTIPKVDIFNNLCIAQMNSGSEFISYVQVKLLPQPCVFCDNQIIDLSSVGVGGNSLINSSDNTKLYSINSNGNGIIVVGALTNTYIKTISIPGNAQFIVVSPTNDKLFALSNSSTGVAYVIDTVNDVYTNSFPLHVNPTAVIHILGDSVTDFIYVSYLGSNMVSVIDTNTESEVATFTAGNEINSFVYNADLKLLYGFSFIDSSMTIIDAVNHTVLATKTYSNGGAGYSNIFGIYVSDNQHLYINVISNMNEILVIDTTNNHNTIRTISVTIPSMMAYNPTNKCIYVKANGGNKIAVIQTLNDNVIKIIDKPNGDIEGIIYASSTHNMYVVDGQTGEVITIDITTNTFTNYHFVGYKPYLVLYNPLADTIYVLASNGFIAYPCISTPPAKTQSVIQTCNFDGKLTYDNGTLTTVSVGGTLPFTYVWSNGATTPTINTTTPGNYTVIVTDANCCKFTAEYQILGQKACWFVMPERPEYVMADFYQDLYGVCGLQPSPIYDKITFNVWDITINNNPINIPAPPLSTTMTPSTIKWTAATNSLVYKCTPGQVTGLTYTNYVDFLNSVFTTLGLTGYKAQISRKAQKVGLGNYNENNGFYILYPENDTFTIKTESVNNNDKYIYSNNGTTDWNPGNAWSGSYNKSFCDGIAVTNGKVIE